MRSGRGDEGEEEEMKPRNSSNYTETAGWAKGTGV